MSRSRANRGQPRSPLRQPRRTGIGAGSAEGPMPQAVASIRGIRVIPVMPGIRAGCQALGVCGTRDTFRPARTLATRFQMEVGPRRYAVGTFFHDGAQLLLGMRASSLSSIDQGQIVSGLVASQVGVRHRKMADPAHLKQAEQASLGTAKITRFAKQQSFQEKQFGVVRVAPQSFPTGC